VVNHAGHDYAVSRVGLVLQGFFRGSGLPRNFVRGGSTNSVEDRENGDLGAVAP